MTVSQPPPKPGLQAERTQLAWERTAIGFLTVGAIVLLPRHGPLIAGRTVVAAAAVLIAFTVFWIGRLRGRRMDRIPQTAVRLVGGSTVVLAGVLVVAILRLA